MPVLRKDFLSRFAWPAYLVLLFTVAGSTLFVEVSAHAAHNHSAELPPTVIAADVHCSQVHQTFSIAITDTRFEPSEVKAHLCDEVVFHDAAAGVIEVAMGPHEQHIAYPGLGNAILGPNQDKHLVLVTAGAFPLHEHLKDIATGTLTVSR